jgi:hypothetical protein
MLFQYVAQLLMDAEWRVDSIMKSPVLSGPPASACGAWRGYSVCVDEWVCGCVCAYVGVCGGQYVCVCVYVGVCTL